MSAIPPSWSSTIDRLHLDREERAAIDAVLTLIANARRDCNGVASRPEPSASAPPPYSELLTVKEIAERLKISRPTVYRMFSSGRLRFVSVGAHRRVTGEELQCYIKEHTMTAE